MTTKIQIDMETYNRKDHFDYFRSLAYPYTGITVNVDVTSLLERCRREQLSFFLMFLHYAALAADSVQELRMRIHEGGITVYDHCPTSHTELLEDGTYCYCTLHHDMPEEEYLRYAETTREQYRKRGTIEEDEDAESMYFVSCLPWMHYTALIQPAAGGDESNPRISWGKYEADRQGRMMMPVTLLVHHALADGIHMAAFYRRLDQLLGNETEEMNTIKEEL